MARLPVRETYECEPALVGSYIGDRRVILDDITPEEEEAGVKKERLNALRNRYVRDFGLFTPGVDFLLKLLEDYSTKSAREFLRSFDAARAETGIDTELAHRVARLKPHGREVANDLAVATA
jgi:hypothetical protein